MRRTVVWIVSSMLLLGLLAPVSAAQDASGIELTPSRIEQDLTSRTFDFDYTIFNHDSEPREVDLRLDGLGHDLDGTPFFPPLETDAVRIDTERLQLAAGESATVTVSGRIPDGRAGSYAGLVVEAQVVEASAQQGVGVRTRVAGLLLIRGPRPWDETLVLDDVQIVDTGSGSEVRVVLANHGDIHVKPTGTIRVERDGRILASVPLEPENIIPGYARRFSGDLSGAELGEGPVTVLVELEAPGGTFEAVVEAVGGETDFAISSVQAAKDDAGTPVVEVTVENVGEQGIAEGTGVLSLSDGPGGLAAEPVTAGSAAMAPGESQRLTFPLDPELPAGPWRAVIQVSAAGLQRSAEATITFPDGVGTTSHPVEATPIHQDRGVLIPVALGLLILALFLVFLVWWLKLRREQEEPVDERAGREHATAVAEE